MISGQPSLLSFDEAQASLLGFDGAQASLLFYGAATTGYLCAQLLVLGVEWGETQPRGKLNYGLGIAQEVEGAVFAFPRPQLLAGHGESAPTAVSNEDRVAAGGNKNAAVLELVCLHSFRVVQEQHLARRQVFELKRLAIDGARFLGQHQRLPRRPGLLSEGVGKLKLILSVGTAVHKGGAVRGREHLREQMSTNCRSN